jgi:formylglycine-generating enzyme required for sulfatase activity
MDLARALRPLMRKVPSRTRVDLDEEATVTQIAETEVWMPVVRPTPERWLELEFVVESSKTTAIWERAIAELNHLIEYQGAFRTVRTWRLSAQGDQVQLFPRWRDGVATATRADQASSARPHTPRELIDPTGRRLIWLVTDCTSPLWRQGIIHPALRQWAMAQPVAIVQMFPDSLWKRTALRDGHPVKLSALAPGLPSARLDVEGLPRRLERRGGADLATVPVVTLDAQVLRHWARVIAGAGDSRTPGRVFDLVFIKRQAEAPKAPASPATLPTAQERVDLFRAITTSETVKHLANLMAATPVVSLPVIDLLRDALRADFNEEVRQSHVAEVLLSGLLRRCDAESDEVCRYEFWGDDSADHDERVRDLLLGDASVTKTLEVLNVLSAAIGLKINSPVKTFQALLAALQTSDDDQLWADALPFAQVGLNVLLRLGGEHAAFARQYEQTLQRNVITAESYFDSLPLQDLEYEVAEFINVPSLESFEFIEAHFEPDDGSIPFPPPLQPDEFTVIALEVQPDPGTPQDLEPFDFIVATIQRRSSPQQERRSLFGGLFSNRSNSPEWEILRQEQQAYLLQEPLPGIASLEMVSIPRGTFLMGSPGDEPERFNSEGPQHEVTVPSFFMGCYPVTQAQWRVVAAMPQVERTLKAAPSRFKGDLRPVEQVTWYDAVEFCARLSAHTGRQYRLPTEAEWEYACRAGTTTPFHFGETISSELANYAGNYTYADGSKGEYRKETTAVDHFGIANAFGLSDMHGNVFEWCQDHRHDNYKGAPTDGSAWTEGGNSERRIRRGGSWISNPRNCRSAYRDFYVPGNDGSFTFGFRVVCSAPRTL